MLTFFILLNFACSKPSIAPGILSTLNHITPSSSFSALLPNTLSHSENPSTPQPTVSITDIQVAPLDIDALSQKFSEDFHHLRSLFQLEFLKSCESLPAISEDSSLDPLSIFTDSHPLKTERETFYFNTIKGLTSSKDFR